MLGEFFSSNSSLYWDVPLASELMRTMWSRKSPNSLLLEVIPNFKCPCWGGWVLSRITYSVMYFSSWLRIILLEACFIPFFLIVIVKKICKGSVMTQIYCLYDYLFLLFHWHLQWESQENMNYMWSTLPGIWGMLLTSPTNISRFPGRN